MRPSIKCIELVKKYEGCKLTAYQCPAKVWTIGYGHTGDVVPGQKITMATATKLLERDLMKFANGVLRLCNNLNQCQFDALVSFAYNCGLGALEKSTLLKKVKANPLDPTIKDEFAKWNKVDGKPLLGLTKRRLEEYNLYSYYAK
jgi:lysozyme